MKHLKYPLITFIFLSFFFCKEAPKEKMHPGAKLKTPFGDTIRLVRKMPDRDGWVYEILKKDAAQNEKVIFTGTGHTYLLSKSEPVK